VGSGKLVGSCGILKGEEVRNANGKELTSFPCPNRRAAARKDKDPHPEQCAWLGASPCKVSEAAAHSNCSWKPWTNAMCFCPYGAGRKSLEIRTPQMKITHFLVLCPPAGEVSSDWGSCWATLIFWKCSDAPYRKLNLTSHMIWPNKVISALSILIYIFS